MARIHLVLLLLSVFLALVSATSAPTFCKCTCFKNSTIIALESASPSKDAGVDSSSLFRRNLLLRSDDAAGNESNETTGDDDDDAGKQTTSRGSASPCSGCTKAFCLNQGLDICEDAEEEDVTTSCFQRDSSKDMIIVWAFIIGTVGLLGWAAFKRLRQWREERSLGRQDISYSQINMPR